MMKTSWEFGPRFISPANTRTEPPSARKKNGLIRIEHQQLDTRIEKSANLIGKAATSFVALTNGLRVVPFDLFPRLRVEAVTGENGQPLPYIQEDRNDDAQFYS